MVTPPAALGGNVPYLVKDINPTGMSFPQYLTKVGDRLFFNADDGVHGQELWVSDGTEVGTYMVIDLVPGSDGSVPQDLREYQGKVLFQVDDNVNGMQWYISDGTAAGTVSVGDVHTDGPGIAFEVCGFWGYESAKAGEFVVYQGENAATGRELWKTDGTPAGTGLLMDLRPGPTDALLHSFDTVGNLAFFATNATNDFGVSPWRSDGTLSGTVQLSSEISAIFFTDVNGISYFRCEMTGTGDELCASDGTPEGTRMVKDIYPGQNESTPINLTNVNGTLFFSAFSPGFGREIWKSDGTEAGTNMVIDLVPGPTSGGTTRYISVNKFLFFFRNDSVAGWQLWKTDGTESGTTLVKVFGPADANGPGPPIAVGANLYFSIDDGIHGSELWVSDGTTEGTYMVYDLYPGPASSGVGTPVAVGSVMYFSSVSPDSTGTELFAFDTGAPAIPTISPVGLGFLVLGLIVASIVVYRCRFTATEQKGIAS
jgi:ELWxxDGT repeat protein